MGKNINNDNPVLDKAWNMILNYLAYTLLSAMFIFYLITGHIVSGIISIAFIWYIVRTVFGKDDLSEDEVKELMRVLNKK